MTRKTSKVLSLLVVFVLAFSFIVAVHSSTEAVPSKCVRVCNVCPDGTRLCGWCPLIDGQVRCDIAVSYCKTGPPAECLIP